MKKVLIFSLNYYPFVGGAEVAIKEITDRLSPEEFEFHALVPHYDSNLPKQEQMGRVLVHRFGFAKPAATISDQSRFPLKLNKYWYQMRAAAYAEHLHRKHRYDGIWGMMAHAAGIPAGIFKSRHPEVKYLLTLQEGDPPEYIEKLMKPVWGLFKQGFASADALQPISNFLLAWGRRMGFTGTAHVIPNAVDTGRFSKPYTASELHAARTILGKKEGETLLITTSRLVYKNAVDDVIRALPLLPEKVAFAVCGIGPDEAMLKALAQELGVAERVRFLGQRAHDELPLLLTASDIFIRPSRSEGMGNSFIEAMAAGIPVIATQEGGIPDFLYDAKRNPDKPTTGWAVATDSPQDIANAVSDILARPEKVREVIATARALAIEKYDWNDVALQMKTLFNELFG
jgi:glycosyltransferase involved in cell wall biosynthesis